MEQIEMPREQPSRLILFRSRARRRWRRRCLEGFIQMKLRNCVTVNKTAHLWKYTAPVDTFSANLSWEVFQMALFPNKLSDFSSTFWRAYLIFLRYRSIGLLSPPGSVVL
jgi:hypothetical protein